jgi:hypothetical protein
MQQTGDDSGHDAFAHRGARSERGNASATNVSASCSDHDDPSAVADRRAPVDPSPTERNCSSHHRGYGNTVSPTPEPMPTPTPSISRLSIEYLRQQKYAGSDIVIEQKLAGGANYDRFITSYLSEGLKIYALLTVPRGQRPDGLARSSSIRLIPPSQYRATALRGLCRWPRALVTSSSGRAIETQHSTHRRVYGSPSWMTSETGLGQHTPP